MRELFATRLKRIRKERGYTQEQLALLSNVSLPNIRRYEQGSLQNKEPNAYHLLCIAQVLDVTPSLLLLGENNMNTYTKAIKNELTQVKEFTIIMRIKNLPLNATVLPHLELSEDLVSDIKTAWLASDVFLDENNKLHYCTSNFVREVIIRYCQNRTAMKKEYNLSDGMIIIANS